MGKKSGKPLVGAGVAQTKATFPRSKADERQEALNHLTYFKEMLAAQEAALKRLDLNRHICAKNVNLWTARIEKMEEKQ